jgi:hypothetical protein
MPLDLTPERGLLFRITHVANLPWLLAHGMHCANGGGSDPDFVAIGNADLIDHRSRHVVPLPPGGTLADYVPFYLTPKSPMLYNIKTGYNGIVKRLNNDIVILVSSCSVLRDAEVRLLFTDRHAYARTATWSDDPGRLHDLIDWDILRRHDFARDDLYPDKMERYQAEALAHRRVPPHALLGVACASDAARAVVEPLIQAAGVDLQVFVRPGWYF